MVGFIVETPLAEDNVGAGVLHSLDHVGEVCLLHLLELIILLGVLNFKPVLGLRFGGLERAGENDDLGIVDFLIHLRMREVLVDDNSLNELGVFDTATSLGNNLNQIKVNILSLNVGDVEHGFDGEVGKVVLALGDDLGAEGCRSTLSKELIVVLGDVKLFSNFGDLVDGDVASALKPIGDLEGVDTLVEEFLGLLKDGTGKNDDTSGAVTDLVVLGGGELGEELRGLMMDLQNRT